MTKTYWKIVEIGSGMCNTPHLTLFTNVFIMKVQYKGLQGIEEERVVKASDFSAKAIEKRSVRS